MTRSMHARALLAALLLAAPLRAQSAEGWSTRPVPPVGARVRVSAPLVFRGWRAGSLVRLDGDSVVLDLDHGGGLFPMPRWQVEAMQLARGRNRVTGALRGLMIGTAVVAVPGALLATASPGSPGGDDGEAVLVIGGLSTLGGFVGLLTGAVAGVQGWEKASMPPPTPRPAHDSGSGFAAPDSAAGLGTSVGGP